MFSISSRFKFIAIGLVLNFLSGNLLAQEDQTAVLEVRLFPVLTFTLNDVNPTLVFDEADDFINGVTYVANNAAEVTASAPYSINVRARRPNLKDNAGNRISVTSIRLEAAGTGIGTTNQRMLAVYNQNIVSNAPAAISKPIDFIYSTDGNDEEFIGKPAGDYTVDLFFTAVLD